MEYSHTCIFLPTARSGAKDSSNIKRIVIFFSCKAAEVSSVLSWRTQLHITIQRLYKSKTVSNRWMQSTIFMICILHVLVVGFPPCSLKIGHNDLLVSHKNPEHASFPAFSSLFEVYESGKTWSLRAAILNLADVTCPQTKTRFHWASKKREDIQTVSAPRAKTFAKNALLPPAWVAQAGRGLALWHGWGCFPLPACNLPCTLLGGDSSSPSYWADIWQPKPEQQRPPEGQLKETAPAKPIKWVPASALISHQKAREGKGRHPR